MNIQPSSDLFFSPVTGKILINPGQVLLGNEKGQSYSSQTIFLENLPSLDSEHLWRGNNEGRPVPVQTITLSNLPDLDRGYIWIGNRNGRPVPTLKLIDLTSDVRRLQAEVDQISFVLGQVSIEPGTLNANRRRLEGVDDPFNPDDAATKKYVDNHTWLSSQITDLSSVPLSFWCPPVNNISMGNYKIEHLADPVTFGDAANLGTTIDVACDALHQIFVWEDPSPSSRERVFPYLYPSWIKDLRLPANRLQGYPNQADRFLSGDGSWSDPTRIVTDATIRWFCIDTTNSEAQATGFMVKSDGQYAAEFGFNHKEQKGYVWTNGNYPLKFGVNGQQKMELGTDGTLDLQQNFITNAILDQLWSDGNNGKLICRTFGSQPSIQLHVPSSLLKPIAYALGSVIGFASTNLHFYGNQNPSFISPTIAEFHSSNQTVATVSSDGEWTESDTLHLASSFQRKDIKEKNYLERLLSIDIYSYKTQERICTSIHHDALKAVFPRCFSDKGFIPSILSYYHILAFQDFYHSQYEPLVKRLEELEKTVQSIV